MSDLSGRKRADALDPTRDLVDLFQSGRYEPFQVRESRGYLRISTATDVRMVAPWTGMAWIDRNEAHDLISEAHE